MSTNGVPFIKGFAGIGVALALLLAAAYSLSWSPLTTFLLKAGLLLDVGAVCLLSGVRWLWGKEAASRCLSRVILLGCSLSAAFVGGELVTRYAFRDVTTTDDNGSYFARKWNRAHVTLNPAGFRERVYSAKPRVDVIRVAVVGDSFTFGQGVDVENRFSNLLERRLNRSRHEVEVLNFGRPGAESADHVRTLEQSVLPANPNGVLLQWLMNDLEDDKSERPRQIPLWPHWTERVLVERSALFYLASRAWTQAQPRLLDQKSYWEYMRERFPSASAPAFQEALSHMDAFFQLCNRHGIHVAVILFPNMAPSLSTGQYEFAYLHDIVREFCRSRGIPVVDLLPFYAKASATTELRLSRLDNHPGPSAHALAADWIDSSLATTIYSWR